MEKIGIYLMFGGVIKRLLILLFVAVLFSCSSDNGTNPDSENREIPSYKLFFENSHYNNEFYTTGDTIQVVLVDTLGIELPDSVEVVLQSNLGDSESIILEKGGQYTRNYPLFFEDSLAGYIISSGSEKSIKRNGVLEVNPQKDSISTYCKAYPEIQEIIPIENIKKEVIDDGRMFEFWNGTWYQTSIPYDNGRWWRIEPGSISVRFKITATQDEIDALNEKYGLTVKSISKRGYYRLQIPDDTDLVYILKEYLNSDIVEWIDLHSIYCVGPAKGK